ncbi:duf602-domain-containing protein [Cyclospora cayetanensis]|uniref:Duf602-domain-containing protein n=1 Tax=Cyclospora cayetanensis TaxID=88456 RepID=A0A1D3CZR3_9EIME|nr:duf602-domain-containing protein [Cyclospora cayetanensis]
MGGDGGSFSGRAEMVRTKGFKFLRNLGGMGYTPNTQIRAGDERFGRNENRDLRTSTCALSEEKLRPPLVVCRVGRLYNKEKVITAMLEKALPPHMKHIKSLKDMKECRIEVNAATGFPICPITKADLSSGVRASIIWPCGFIVSNRALEAMTQKDAEISHPEHKISDSGKPRIKGTFVCPIQQATRHIIAMVLWFALSNTAVCFPLAEHARPRQESIGFHSKWDSLSAEEPSLVNSKQSAESSYSRIQELLTGATVKNVPVPERVA